jgi:hypothetical protein
MKKVLACLLFLTPFYRHMPAKFKALVPTASQKLEPGITSWQRPFRRYGFW